MNTVKKLLFGAVALIFVVLAAVIVGGNQDTVQISFLVWKTPAVPVFWWILAALVVGVLTGYLLSYLSHFNTRRERKRLRRSVDEQASEIQRLKTVSTDAVPDA